MTSAIETALTELSANLRRMEQRHQAAGYKFDRLYGLIDAAREELASLTADAVRYRWLTGARSKAQAESLTGTIFTPLLQDRVLHEMQCFFLHKEQADSMIDQAMGPKA